MDGVCCPGLLRMSTVRAEMCGSTLLSVCPCICTNAEHTLALNHAEEKGTFISTCVDETHTHAYSTLNHAELRYGLIHVCDMNTHIHIHTFLMLNHLQG